MRKVSKVHAAWLSVAALTIGATIAVSHFYNGQSVYAAAPSDESLRVQALSDAVYSSFDGTQAERDAGAVLQAYALNGGLDQCMEQAGYANWDWSVPRAQNATTPGLGTSEFFGPPLAQEHTTALLESAASAKADQKARTRTLTPAQDKQVRVCLDTTPPAAGDDALNSPPEASRLRELWWTMLRDLDEKYGDPYAYAQCIADSTAAGLPDGVTSADSVSTALSTLHPETQNLPESRQDPLTASSEWQALVRAEAAWEAVDWGCRGEVYNRHIEAVGSAVQEFSETHAEEIVVARTQWEEITKEAASLGYDGTFGPVDGPP